MVLLWAALLLSGFDWALLRTLFVPFSALIGGTMGAFLAVELARVAGVGSGSGLLWGALAAGAVLGGGGGAGRLGRGLCIHVAAQAHSHLFDKPAGFDLPGRYSGHGCPSDGSGNVACRPELDRQDRLARAACRAPCRRPGDCSPARRTTKGGERCIRASPVAGTLDCP